MNSVSSLYIHVPFCRHLCNYCDFYKTKFDAESTQIESFHRFLSGSWEQHQKLLSQNGVEWSSLETVYLGGGTPSLWGNKGADFFSSLPLKLREDCEFTMEIDPGTWTPEMINTWKNIGLNRISIGTQTLHPDFLKIMDRSHSLKESHDLLSYCQKNDWNFSLDFLLGLPFSREKKRDILQELNELLQYSPKHISLYILNARSKYPHSQHLPDDEFIREEYLAVSEHLRKRGFLHYEVSNFALPGFESKHNLKYWKSESVAALGPTGTGYFAFHSERATRYKWKVTKAEFEKEELGVEELSLERTYLTLRTSLGWAIPEKARDQVHQWESLGYANILGDKAYLTALGYLMLDSLMNDLFKIRV